MRTIVLQKPLTVWCLLAAACLTASAGCASLSPTKKTPPATPPAIAAASDEDGASAAAAASPDAPPADKPPAKPAKDSSKSISDLRDKRLSDIAADFDHRRDEAQYQAAVTRWRADDGNGCRECLQQLITRNPNHCPARLLLAEVALTQGNPKEALAEARQVLALDPASAEANHEMALALDAIGESPAALLHYERAARLDPQNEQYRACFQAAADGTIPPPSTGEPNSPPPDNSTNIRSANYTEAADPTDLGDSLDESDRTGATQSPKQVPQDATARAMAALRADRPQEAAELAIAGLHDHPNSAPLYRVLGAARYREGDYASAQVEIGQALSLDKSDALSYFLMGSTLSRLGQSDAAQRQFAEAARLDPRYSQPRD